MIPYLIQYKLWLRKQQNNFVDPEFYWEYRNSPNNVTGILLKHDVECYVDRAVNMAKIENELGIKSIYLFQGQLLNQKNYSLIKEIKTLGHEIGYHYDVLDEYSGDFGKALKSFNSYVDKFSKLGFNVRYVCPHGNPSKIRIGYNSNKDFWLTFRDNFKGNIYDLVMDYSENFYSDVSYGFYKVKRSNNNIKETLIKTDFASKITDESLSQVSIHSHRWSKYWSIAVMRYLRFKFMKRLYSILSTSDVLKRFMGRFFKMAKTI